MNLTFKNRIAFYYMLATAIIIAVVFSFVYFVVKTTVYRNLDNDLSIEAKKHSHEIILENGALRFINKAEWEEKEHRQAQVNPIFIQLINNHSDLIDKSPNLKADQLQYKKNYPSGSHFNATLNGKAIRQVQIPLEFGGVIKGQILSAMSLESSLMVLKNLRNIIFILYPLVLLGLFFISRILAGRSIRPVQIITNTTNNINKFNLSARVPLPPYKDELHDLSYSINNLLDRIESAVVRERQFTSDASHELRTPLATIKGTLEVLIRKSRSEQEYIEKINYSLLEIDRTSQILEQLLVLARFDKEGVNNNEHTENIVTIIDEVITRRQNELSDHQLSIAFRSHLDNDFYIPQYHTSLIFDNIIGNAIKYSPNASKIHIDLSTQDGRPSCKISDSGLGISKDHIDQIFQPFFRSSALEHKHIKGSGLGLSIAHKAAVILGAQIQVKSELEKGSTFTITF